jgi:nucleoside-diphosphate-sugar epimerase
MAYFLTGSSGFVGNNLAKYLGKINVRELNLRGDWSNQIVKNSNFSIIHLAGKAHDLRKTSNPDEYYEVNFELTKKLFDAFLKSDAEKFIFISSVKAVADKVDLILTEDAIPNPLTHYGKSKLMAEQYIQNQVLPAGKSYYILRPCMIHGPGNKGNLNLLYNFVQKGIPFPLAAFHNKRSFLSIENLCFVIKIILEQNIQSGIYNISDDAALSINEVVSIFSKSLDKKTKLWELPPMFVKKLAKIGDFFSLSFNTERLEKLTENYIVSNKKIKGAIKLSFPIKAEVGLLLTAGSFRSDKRSQN